jgi:hypothetical protein
MLSCTSRSFPLISLICLLPAVPQCFPPQINALVRRCARLRSKALLPSRSRDRRRLYRRVRPQARRSIAMPAFALTTACCSRTASTHSFPPPLDISTVLRATQPTAVMLLSIPLSSDSSTNASSFGDSLLLGPSDLRSPCDCFVNCRSHGFDAALQGVWSLWRRISAARRTASVPSRCACSAGS